MHSTSRLLLEVPDNTDPVANYPGVSGQQMSILDNAALYTQGTIGSRPSAGSVEAGHLYRATDTGDLAFSDGAAWHSVFQFASGTASARPAAGVAGRAYRATDTGEWSLENGSSWQSLIATRGAVNITASESTSSASYTTLTTPDQVTGIVLPTNGLIAVWYQATWQESVGQAGRAAIFIGSTQLHVAGVTFNAGTGSSVTQAAATGNASPNLAMSLATSPTGLVSLLNPSYSGDVTTGQIVGVVPAYNALTTPQAYAEIASQVDSVGVPSSDANFSLGGPCYIFAAAGTYTIGVQFKASPGSVTASNRKLWVMAIPFA